MNKTIMVVEDDQIFHDLYTELLEDTNYKLILTYDGDEALARLEEEKPDLIILDMILDMMTGDTFFLYLKGMPEYADIPVIVVSNVSSKPYESLKEIDPNLTFLRKTYLTKERLLEEIDKKLIEKYA